MLTSFSQDGIYNGTVREVPRWGKHANPDLIICLTVNDVRQNASVSKRFIIVYTCIQFNSIYFKTHNIKKQAIQIQIISHMVRMKYN